MANMKLLSGLICGIVLFCSMGAGPCWQKHNSVVAPVPAAPYVPVYQQYYVPVVVQNVRYLPVVENRVEYRPVVVQPQIIGWNYYPVPVYGINHYYNPWATYNY